MNISSFVECKALTRALCEGTTTECRTVMELSTMEPVMETAPESPVPEASGPTSADDYPSVEELIAKARAPVKREYVILNCGPRQMATSVVMTDKIIPSDVVAQVEENKNGDVPQVPTIRTVETVAVDKKSKRQMKRERKEARSNKSVENVCGAVAKTGDAKGCKYGTSCRFNHDLVAYLQQKPADIEGKCPFLDLATTPCPYGYACRYAGTHPESKGDITERLEEAEKQKEEKNPMSSIRETNNLNKTFQKLLWKNAVTFPKADAQLQALGLLGKAKKLNVKQSLKEKENEKDCELEVLSGDALMDPDIIVPETTDVLQDSREDEQSIVVLNIKDGHPLEEDVEMLNGTKQSNATEKDSPPQKRVRISAGDPSSPMKPGPETNVVGDMDTGKYTGDEVRIPMREKKIIDFRKKLYLAPLTTVGNLPFRRVCKRLGADITCGEMAMCINLLQGQASEWALLRRHEEEDLFGVQICGSHADTVSRAAEVIERECTIDFIDLNLGCPIDLVVNKGGGSSLLCKPTRLKEIVKATSATIDTPLTLKLRMGFFEGRNCAHTLIPDLGTWGASAVTIHGRTRQQRYSKVADWNYINQCVSQGPGDIQLIGNGDVFSYTEFNEHLQDGGLKLSTCMIARGALIKPWLFTEIKEQRHWDITAQERLNILFDFVKFGLIHWGSDSKGVETTRHFLLEWLSYAHRYIPVGVLEVVPQKLNWRPPNYFGRNDLETLMASDSAADWGEIACDQFAYDLKDYLFGCEISITYIV